ncbi:uncharacterized protein LOC111314003 isoform X2 [Durio zibethinus]|uniref:Uncharacterized protein LOC111314003 isoform X2 n=1 Tax=Durio zibethinus TaxID=66656 RepID=A0A6P6B0U5_DURZI|nr:uncharacterized protein LOC111314003 isoform X2 [Durio zibethinus]
MGVQKICHWKSGVSICHGQIPGLLKGQGKGKEDNPVYGPDSGLREILSLDTWNSCLTEEERFSLSAYLPDMDEWTFWLTMKELFTGSDMYFGNPMDTFFKRLKGGFYSPKITCLRESLQFLERRRYYHALRSYHDKMAQMLIEMRRLWDECDTSAGVEERLYMWRTRKCEDANLLDLNAVPHDGYLLNEDLNSDAVMRHLPKRMKSWESVRAKNIVASPSANGMNIIAPNCSTKGVLNVKTSGNAIHNHNQKMVVGDITEQRRSVPKGLLKVVPKVPSVLPLVSKVFSRRSQTALLVGAQDLQDHRVSYSQASTHLGNAGDFSGSPFLWQKVAGSKMNHEQSQCMLNRQDSALRNSRYLHNSSENVRKEVDIADLDKHKLFEQDEESFIDSKRFKFGGHNLWQNFAMGKKGFFERSLESYPFSDQYHEGERQTRILQKECITILPTVPEAVLRDSGIRGGMQEKLMAFPNQMKSPSDFTVENSEKPSKPSVSERLKYDLALPLTYKRRRPQAKNSSGVTNSLITGTNLRSGSPKESNQPLGESVKALKIKFMGWENTPLNGES